MATLTEHSRVALARIFLSDHGNVKLKVDGRSIDPLMRRGLVAKEDPRRGITSWTPHYHLTDAGKVRCTEPDLLVEIRRQAHLEADRSTRQVEELEHQARFHRNQVAGLNKVRRLLELAR